MNQKKTKPAHQSKLFHLGILLRDRIKPKARSLLILLLILSSGLGLFLGLSPKKTQQSMVDEIALHGLGAYLSDLGAEKSSSVCWIGDPQSVYLNKFIGTQDSIWDRWKEKARSKSWSRKLSCFDPGFKAIVAIFPLPEVVYSSMAREDSIALQAEASELLSQSGRAENLIKRNVLFHLQAGIQLMIYSRP